MTHPERQYLDLLADILQNGNRRLDRTGIGTLAVFGRVMRFDLAEGFPILTTKKVLWRHAFAELLWFLRGETNIRPLLEQSVTIWSDWPHQGYVRATGDQIDIKTFEKRVLQDAGFAARWGELGPVYGKQWRRWRTADGREIDQVAEALRLIRDEPASRRIIVEGWNVGELEQMALPPCHKNYQFWVADDRLSVALYQRSADTFLGVVWNCITAALFLSIMADQAGLRAGEVVWFGADVHLYLNHIEQAREQLRREPRPFPQLRILRKADSFDSYRLEDFAVEGYQPHAAIKAAVAV